MLQMEFVARVDPELCSGCQNCLPVCPAGAITMVERAASVDPDRCIDCQRCIDRCNRENAIHRERRPEAVLRCMETADVNQEELANLCRKAGVLPDMPICGCNRITGREAVAAIMKGAATPEDLCAATGLRAGCGIYCMTRIFQLFDACGVELENPPDRRWIKLTLSLADLPEEKVEAIDRAYPQCCVGEDWKRLMKRRAASPKKEGSHA